MLEIFDLNRKKQAVLQNAFGISEDKKVNAISTFSFSLPCDDSKNSYCNPFWTVRYNDGDLYRVAACNKDNDTVTYECEHVISTLMNTSLQGFHIIGNIGVYTADVIRYVLSKQSNWVLGECDFSRQFEYGWENENLLGALFSVPTLFTEKYMWVFDTKVFPWKVSLKKISLDVNPQLYIRTQKNMLSLNHPVDYKRICTKLTPLGAGEGINQLGIAGVNGGVKHLLAPQKYIDMYGIIELTWTDRRYTNEQSLMEAARTMLTALQEPYEEYDVGFAQLQGGYFDHAEIGKVAQIVDSNSNIKYNNFIVGIAYNHDDVSQSAITLANKPQDIASSIADLADRQRIEMTYSQGATQLYAQSIQANADTNNGTVLNFFIPAEMKIINKVIAKVQLESFRAYSQATDGGGGSVQSSSSGGGSYTSTDWSGSTYASTDWSGNANLSGGGYITSGASYIDFSPWGKLNIGGSQTYQASGSGSHSHGYLQGWIDFSNVNSFTTNHQHQVNTAFNIAIPAHGHSVSIGAHGHNVSITEHAHNVTIPNHMHTIKPGIYKFGNPSNFSLYVNGTYKATFNSRTQDVDLTSYLVSNGSIPRGSFHKIEIRPNDLAYISIDMFVQGFVQSRGDNTL